MKKEVKTTSTFKQYEHYYQDFYLGSDFAKNVRTWRDFAKGEQYLDIGKNIEGLPRPVFNIIGEAVNKIVAKILGTPYHVSFVSDNEKNLSNIDLFYEHQMNAIKNKQIQAMVVKEAVITGVGISVTSWDEDTFGSQSLFKGFLKKQVLRFEDCFFSNPYNQDIQDNAYCGFRQVLEIASVKELLHGYKDSELKKIKEEIVPDDYYENYENYENIDVSELDRKSCTVFTKFFRQDGEVYYMLSTKYVDLFKEPLALNPRKNYKEKEVDEKDSVIKDVSMDSNKNLTFSSPKKQTDSEYKKEKNKFSLYPLQVYCPNPVIGRINGESLINQMIPNQKLINYMSSLVTIIMRNHAAPKYMAKSDALRGQIISNDPGDIIYDYSRIPGTWGIQRLNAGDAIYNNLVEMMLSILSITRNLNGVDDLTSSANSSNSGYAYEQRVKQANLVLEQPQARFWEYIGDCALVDINFFKHFMDNAKFYYFLDDSEVEQNEIYRSMSQKVIDKENANKQMPFQNLNPTKKLQVKEISKDMFDNDFAVSVEVEEGIVGSQISESQHYNEIMQYALSGNADSSLIKAMILGDPACSAKTKKRAKNYLENLEISEVTQLKEQIAMLQQELLKMSDSQNKANNLIKLYGSYMDAKDKATKEQDKVNQTIIRNLQNEGEVKSQNAKGISGGSFSSSSD